MSAVSMGPVEIKIEIGIIFIRRYKIYYAKCHEHVLHQVPTGTQILKLDLN